MLGHLAKSHVVTKDVAPIRRRKIIADVRMVPLKASIAPAHVRRLMATPIAVAIKAQCHPLQLGGNSRVEESQDDKDKQ